jgi:hypothetical protein
MANKILYIGPEVYFNDKIRRLETFNQVDGLKSYKIYRNFEGGCKILIMGK